MNALTVPNTVSLPSDPMQLMALAERLAMARLIPPHFQKSPADCWLVMSFCRSRNLDFLMVVGECSVVQGRLFFSGKLTAALLNTSGHLADRLSYDYEYSDKDKTDVYGVTVSGRLNNEATPRTIHITLNQVKTNNKVWTSQPEQQLAYAGARTWGRRHAPEVLMGLLFEGETIDITPTDAPQSFTPRLAPVDVPKVSNELLTRMAKDQIERDPISSGAPKYPPPGKTYAEATREDLDRTSIDTSPPVEPCEIPLTGDDVDAWSGWAKMFMASIRAAPTADAINEWQMANADNLQAFQARSEKSYLKLVDQVKAEIEGKSEEGT